jgi:uroporphyrinogen decarboxylase
VSDLFLRACRGEATPRPPLWIMRQAGRYLPEYREVRSRVSFLELCKTPELAAEVTLQPIRRFDFDAAILFSDLLVPLEAMGLNVAFTEQGPSIDNPVRAVSDLDRLSVFDPAQKTPFVAEAIRLIRKELGETPLIGFAGAPFTVATYAIEGKTSRRFTETKAFFYREPNAAHRLLALIAEATRRYLLAQVAAGAQAIQIFDSWLGAASPEDWDEFVLGPTRALVQAVRGAGVPVIYFPHGAGHLIDWRVPIDEARTRLAHGGVGVGTGAGAGAPDTAVAVQGNLDPSVLLGPPERIQAQVADIVRRGGRRGHIFNLGHGIHPETPIASVETLVRAVKTA